MYALNPALGALWRELLLGLAQQADVPLRWVEHDAPAPLAELWQRDDLGCAFICGYPWATWSNAAPRPLPLAAPLPHGEPRPQYASDIVVRADAPFTRIDDLFGRRIAWTVEDSQSGYQALRTWLAPQAQGGALFGGLVGPLVTPRKVVEAVLSGQADGGPLDSYAHALWRHNEPALVAGLRVVAQTPPTPMPLLVAAASMPEPERDRLRARLLACATRPDLKPLLDALCLDGFGPVDPREYARLGERAREADRLGYPALR